jgi:hypothetical protein
MAAGPVPQVYSDSGDKTKDFQLVVSSCDITRQLSREATGMPVACELDGVEKRVGRGHALLSPLCQAIAANAALVIGDVNRLGWPALHRLDLDRRALQRPVLQKRLHRSSIRRTNLLLNTPRSTAPPR